MMKRSSIFFLGSLFVSLAACSSSSSSGGGTTASVPSAFTSYCTGTLSVDKTLMRANGTGWEGDGSLHAAAGTKFLVSAEFGQWGGYVFESDGSATEIDTGVRLGLVKGTDFTSDCASDSALSSTGSLPYVVLAHAHLFASSDLSGAACVLDPGTALSNYSFENIGGPAQISGDLVTSKCGWSKAYSIDFHAGYLIAQK